MLEDCGSNYTRRQGSAADRGRDVSLVVHVWSSAGSQKTPTDVNTVGFNYQVLNTNIW